MADGTEGGAPRPPRYRVEAAATDRATAEAAAAELRARGLDAAVRTAGSLPSLAAGGPADPGAIVAVGMGLAVPGAGSPDELWDLLRDRVPQFSEPGDRMDIDALWSADPAAPDKTYTRTSGFIHDMRPHPRLRAELAAGRAAQREPSGRWLRHSVLQALDGVRLDAGTRTFAAVGMTADGGHAAEHSLLRHGARLLAGPAAADPEPLAALYPAGSNDLADTAPYRVVRDALAGIADPVETVVVDTACSSSLYSFDFGMRALREGRADVALCGGAYSVNAQTMVLFAKLDGLAGGDRVRSLDRGADGVLFSDGAAVVALKTYARALADGDPVLGFVRGFGGSSDGRGKAVYAPNPAGQRIALERAWAAAGVGPEDVDWIVAHATGTAAGDQAELRALAAAAPGRRWTLTSNKSLIGHTGWAAGAVNVIHALLALRHEAIPGQHLYTEPVADDVTVPVRTLSWRPSPDGRARTAGVSAMGFGGTNAHVVVSDRPGPAAPAAADPAPVVVVATTALEPPSPGPVFGASFATPAPLEVRLPPAVLERLDRSQLMALRCALDLRPGWDDDPELLARTGVFVGHSGQVRQALACTLRAYLDDIEARAEGDVSALTAGVRALAPESNSDSLPGLMPNIIASRVAQLLDLHGPNMTLDAGPDSSHAALAAACRHLATGELSAAVVIGTTAAAELVTPPAGGITTETAAAAVLMPRQEAEARGLRVLGELRVSPPAGVGADTAAAGEPTAAGGPGVPHGPVGGAAPDAADAAPYFHAAEGLVALHRAVRANDAAAELTPAAPGTPALTYAPESPAAPDRLGDLRPYVLRLKRLDRPEVRPALPALPPGTLVLTNAPAAPAGLELPPGCVVAAPRAAQAGPAPDVHVLDAPEDLAGILTGRELRHVRVLFDTRHRQGTPRPAGPPDALPTASLELHELAFAAAHLLAEPLGDRGSFAVLVLDPGDPAPAPATGLFTGLVRALGADLPGGLVYGVVTDAPDLPAGLGLLSRESAVERHLAVAHHRRGVRAEAVLAPVGDRPAAARLPRAPVVVATGGGRGITAELVDQLAGLSRPAAIWLLGSGPAPGPADAAAPPADRPAALRRLMAEHPGAKLADLNRRYNRALQAAERGRTLRRLAARYGADRVHYRQCDVLDPGALRAVAAEIAAAGGADVVVHGAGVERATALRRKTPAEFRAVRDVKVRGWLNLRAAFAAHDPALWLAISSVTTVVARPGEADYISANEFLTHAAAHGRATSGADVHALVSGLWTESGMVTHTQVQDAYLAREDNFTHLDDALGRRYFRTELLHRRSDPRTSVWLGETEWRMLAAAAPELRAAGTWPPAPGGAFVRGPGAPAEGGGRVWEVRLGLDDHGYVRDHRVDERPTLPGTFIMEIAAEAAAAVGAGRPVAIVDALFVRFVRAAEEQWPRRLVVTARAETAGRVRVVVAGPPRGPIPAQEYSRMTVLLDGSYGPRPDPGPAADGLVPARDAYALAASPVLLRGMFDSLRELRTGPAGGSARLHLPPPGHLGPLRDFLLPALAMDSLLRATAATADSAEDAAHTPVPVPVRIDRFDLFAPGNDAALAEAPAPVDLRHRTAADGTVARCEAVGDGGRVLFAFTGLATRDKRVAATLATRPAEPGRTPGPPHPSRTATAGRSAR
ncbi:SDR family NAD(P)-dependent oxidoreductase [Streptomyces sp. NBC_01808]|uniref:SDR family NAD(P)-dependent oxidoreductase n=1 Tax=Streptomyces sp. NBC_01808 TaxID=2975947 RepID=UPI002DD8E069|nr:SDR family NAD(P)-dependent oxidoreductase [Streptomyces sp. NBC_01808]WSA41825.1 SDR family NAD(P)-dependent oxidoreductase [Streptomyces sp. NBC_01808]